LILWTGVALLWIVPVPAFLGRAGLWAGVAMFFALSFYLRLSRPLGFGMLAVFVLLGLITESLYRVLGPGWLMWLAIGVFVLAWIAQFIGHQIEGKRPSFLTDLAYLLIGQAPRERAAAAGGLLSTSRLLGQTMAAVVVGILLASGAGLGPTPLFVACALAVVAALCSMARFWSVTKAGGTMASLRGH